MIHSNGQFTNDAAQTFGEIVPGTNSWCDVYQIVTVSGKTPSPGCVFAQRLEDGAIIQLPAANRPAIQHKGSYTGVKLPAWCPKNDISPAADTIGNLTQGQFFDTGAGTTPNGRMGRKVMVFRPDGTTALPPGLPVASEGAGATGTVSGEAVGALGETHYVGTLTFMPRPGTLVLTAGDLRVTDDGNGHLVGSVGSGNNTIDYRTATYEVTFSAATSAAPTAAYEYAHYHGNLAHPPIPGSVVITDGTRTVTDNGAGKLIGDVDPRGHNYVNYSNGAFDFIFSLPVAGQTPTIAYSYPDVSKCWRLLFDGDVVEAVDVTSAIESYGNSVAEAWSL
jgi:hypothetical protein